jgi:chromosome segregation ATPase
MQFSMALMRLRHHMTSEDERHNAMRAEHAEIATRAREAEEQCARLERELKGAAGRIEAVESRCETETQQWQLKLEECELALRQEQRSQSRALAKNLLLVEELRRQSEDLRLQLLQQRDVAEGKSVAGAHLGRRVSQHHIAAERKRANDMETKCLLAERMVRKLTDRAQQAAEIAAANQQNCEELRHEVAELRARHDAAQRTMLEQRRACDEQMTILRRLREALSASRADAARARHECLLLTQRLRSESVATAAIRKELASHQQLAQVSAEQHSLILAAVRGAAQETERASRLLGGPSDATHAQSAGGPTSTRPQDESTPSSQVLKQETATSGRGAGRSPPQSQPQSQPHAETADPE